MLCVCCSYYSYVGYNGCLIDKQRSCSDDIISVGIDGYRYSVGPTNVYIDTPQAQKS